MRSFRKTRVNTCGVKWPIRESVSAAAELLQMSSGGGSQREVRTASQLPSRLFSPNERTHKAADKTGDKGLCNGVGGGSGKEKICLC